MNDNKFKILVVEDDELVRELLLTLLSEEYESLGVGTPAAALERLDDFHPDLILLDGMLPGMDGVELCRQIKRHPRGKNTPVIFVSARTEPEEEARGLEAGAVDYVHKPLSPPILLARLRNHLSLAAHLRASQSSLEAASQLLVNENEARSRAESAQSQLESSKKAITKLLESSLQPLPLQQQLLVALDIINEIPWLKIESQGAIFLTNRQGELILAAEKGLSAPLKKLCARVAPGQCLCGRAAQTRELVFAPCVDEYHGTTFEGMKPHGHYALPLQYGDHLLGVLTVYLPDGHQPIAGELEFMQELAGTLASILQRRIMEELMKVREVELEIANYEVIEKLSRAAEFRDTETGMHVLRMSHYSAVIARAAGLGQEECELILKAASMHDLGKIGIPDDILLKKGKLTAEEFEAMKAHTTIGGQLLEGEGAIIRAARTIALSHHEKWDGSGYPAGLKGEGIPLMGRICALADVFDALTMERPYKKPWTTDEALDFIRKSAGSHFDPLLVEVFEKSFDEILAIKNLYRDDTINPREQFIHPVQFSESGEAFHWESSFEVGIDIIDTHHKYLFILLNQISHAIEQDLGACAVGQTLFELDKYAKIHFKEEERMMEKYGYPLLEQHRAMHDSFIGKIREFWLDLRHNPIIVGTEVVDYLTDWLVRHIQKTDKEIINLIELPPSAEKAAAL